MSKKLFTVQAVLKSHFNNRPPMPFGAQRRVFNEDPVLPIPAERRPTLLQMSKPKAIQEAERLARQNPNYVFLVMESVHMAFQDEFVSRSMENV